MTPRVYQVCLTYLLRWPVWLVAVVYVTVCGIAISLACFGSPFGGETNVSPSFPLPGPMANLNGGNSLDPVDRRARSLYWTASHQGTLTQRHTKPLLTVSSLEIFGELTSASALQILRMMPNLRALSVLCDLPPEGLLYVAELADLRYLRLIELSGSGGLRPLSGLTQLQILDILGAAHYSLLFRDLEPFQNLHTLVVQSPLGGLFQESDWQKLRTLPRLKYLYLRGNSSNVPLSREAIDRVQEILPHVQVRPASVQDRRANVWCLVVCAGVLVWAILCIQLQSQFSHAGSCLMPHYANTHLKVAVAVWLITTGFHISLLCLAGCALGASLAGSLIFPSLYWGYLASLLNPTRRRPQLGALNPIFTASACTYTLPLTLFISRFFLSDLDWFLQGRQPVLALGIFLACLIPLGLVLRRIPRLHLIYEDSIAGVPPLGVSPKAWTKWVKNLATQQDRPRKIWGRGDRSAELEAVLSTPHPRSVPRLRVAAHGIDVNQVVVRIGTITAIYVVFLQLLTWLEFFPVVWQSQFSSTVTMMSGLCTEGFFVGLILIWQGRCNLLGYELLRPASRKQFVNDLFTAVWLDMRPILICQVLVVAILLGIVGVTNLPPWYLPALICYCVFRMLSNYVAILFFLAIRRMWIKLFISLLVWFAVFSADTYFALSTFRADAWLPFPTIAACIIGSIVSWCFLVWLRGRWNQLELA